MKTSKNALMTAIVGAGMLAFAALPASASGEVKPVAATPAATDAAPVSAGKPAETAATRFVEDLSKQAIAIAKEVKANPAVRDERFRKLLNDGFDVNSIGKFVLGRHWQTASEEERSKFMQLFEQLIVDDYAVRLSEYTNETIGVRSTRTESDGAVTVMTEIARATEPPLRVDWKIGEPATTPRIVDVSVEGVSLVLAKRQEFASVIRAKGGVAGLNEALQGKLKKN